MENYKKRRINMENYKKVEVTNYVKQGIENGTMVPRQAEKKELLVKLLFLGVLMLKEMKFKKKLPKFKLMPKRMSPGGLLLK